MKGRIVLLGRKKLFWSLVVVLVTVCPIMVASYIVPAEDVTGPAGQMLTYRSDKEGIKFSYPQGWLLRTERDFTGAEIIESVSFISPDRTAHGFVQVMKLAKSIPDYISDAEKSMAPGYDSLDFRQTAVGDRQGFVLSYKRGTGDARTVATEYFFKKNEKVYRFSCFYPEGMADQYAKQFEEMLAGFRF